MRTKTNHIEFEQLLFGNLRPVFPGIRIEGHISVVHTDWWWVCYVFVGTETSLYKFRGVTRQTERELSTLWDQPYCCPPDNTTGIDTLSRHFFNVWLPVSPNCTPADFAKFYST